MAKTKREEAAEPAPSVPDDALWDPDREITMYAVIPCRTGHRMVEMTTTVREAATYGTISELDVGDVVFARAKRRMLRQAVEA